MSGIQHRSGFISCLTGNAALIGVTMIGAAALAGWGGYLLGEQRGLSSKVDVRTTEVRVMLDEERRAIEDAKAEQRAHLDALALKIGELQAHMLRLDALGGRLVEVGKLDSEEFDFTAPPPLGGVDEIQASQSQSALDLRGEMDKIAQVLDDRSGKLEALEQVLMDRELMAEVLPSGKPVMKGWISSTYGQRTDPFTGRRSLHRGVDFAGKPGSDVVSVASGVVTRAERTAGYGNLVEIRHANGYSTRYAHNKKNTVSVGDVVGKGDVIALLGSTGRSSGPHVHFEVHRDGNVVNPAKFLQTR